MGKQRKERRKLHKKNPTGLPSVKDFKEEEAANVIDEDRETALQRVYDEIQSANVEEKLSGLQTLETMSCDSGLAMQMAQNGIAKMVGPLLVDNNVLVRAGSASALRHIAENGKAEAHEHLLKDDIMTPLCSLLKQHYVDWKPMLDQNDGSKRNDEKEAFVQAVTLLWTLCENNELAIKYSNDKDLVSILIKFFDTATYGVDIATVTTQCLLSLSEDNSDAIEKLDECEDMLMELLLLKPSNGNHSELVCFKTAVTGLLVSMSNYMGSSSIETVLIAIGVLSGTLSINCKQLLSKLTSILPHEKNAFSSSHRKTVQESRKLFGAQQQALEILANVCSEDIEYDENDSDLEDCEIEGTDDVCMDDKSCKMNFYLPLEIIELLQKGNIVKKVWEKTVAVDKDTVEILEQYVEGRAVLQQMHTLRCRAYLCLNNLVSSLEIEALGDLEDMYRMWVNIGTVVFKDANPNDTELLESATAAMRSILQRLSQLKPVFFDQITLDDLQPMLNGERQCTNANVRANLIRILGSIALIFISKETPESRELIKQVTAFLLDACTTESKVWVMAETLDAIMDIYAEDETDQLANEVELVGKLHSLVSVFKTKMRLQKNDLGDNVAIVSTVNTNFIRFIRYKEKRMRNI